MRSFVPVVFAMSLAMPAALLAQDPVTVDPAHHKVEIDNADVRVLRITFAPGDKAPLHDHPNSVAIFLAGGTNRLTTPGQKPTESAQQRGDVVMLPASKHMVENIGKTATEVILVEMKKPGMAGYKGMALDPVKLNPKNYVVVAQNEHARVIRIRAAAGDQSVEHEHPSNVVISFTEAPGEKPGAVTWHPGPEKHGGTPPTTSAALEVVVVELKSGAGAK